MLKFLGMGSAFNTELGNNSAYIKNEDSLFLIDCGGMVFHLLQKNDLIYDSKNIHVFITHTHPDHIGSLGDLIFYMFYIKGIKINIHFPDKKLLKNLLTLLGVNRNFYILHDECIVDFEFVESKRIVVEFLQAEHVETIPAYSLLINFEDFRMYYSGDTYVLPDFILEMLEDGYLTHLYHDTSGWDSEENKHMPFNRLKKLIKPEYRERVYCMHFDKGADFEEIRQEGFKIVE